MSSAAACGHKKGRDIFLNQCVRFGFRTFQSGSFISTHLSQNFKKKNPQTTL